MSVKSGYYGLHKINIQNTGFGRTKIEIDGNIVKSTGYCLEGYVGEVPTLTLELATFADDITVCGKVKIANKEKIASLMSRSEFDEFCEIWKGIHEEVVR